MKLFYVIILGLMVLVSACAQQPEPAAQPAEPPEVQPESQPEEPEEVEVAAEETIEEITLSGSEIRVLAQAAFEPNTLTINVGDSVTWINSDSAEAVIIIFKDKSAYMNSVKFDPGEKFEHEFTEAGSYQYWRNLAFSSDGGTITVE